MHSLQIDRRTPMPGASAGTDIPRTTRIVRQGLLLQSCLGTVGAVEYLKTHEVAGAVIGRVLSRERLRQEDHALLAQGDAGRLAV